MAQDVIDIQVDMSGLDDIQVRISSIVSHAQANIKKALLAFGYTVQADAIELIQQGPKRTGTIYFVGGKRAQRSSSGEPAKTDTGMLASSIRVIEKAMGIDVGYSNSIAPYGKYLEDTSKLNRPVLEPTFVKNKSLLIKLIEKAVKDSIIKLTVKGAL